MFGKVIILMFAFAAATAIPLSDFQYNPSETEDGYDSYLSEETDELHRIRRSLQPGAPNFPNPSQNNGGWSVNPNVARDDSGNTRTDIEIQHKGDNHEVNAGWGKVVRGPNKAKPTWHVGGTFKW